MSEIKIPELKTIWEHKESGREYRVLMIANVNANKKSYPVTVVYEECGSGRVWSKSLAGFMYSMKEKEKRRSKALENYGICACKKDPEITCIVHPFK